MTEAAFFSSKGQQNCFKELGVEQYKFIPQNCPFSIAGNSEKLKAQIAELQSMDMIKRLTFCIRQ